MKLDLGIVVPELAHYGGAEVFLLECMRRWQYDADITLYTADVSRDLLREYLVEVDLIRIVELPASRGRGLLEDLVLLPRQWEQLIGHHDSHLLFLYPSHFVKRRPSVSLVSEPMRMLYDLRFQFGASEDGSTAFHVYPRMSYERGDGLEREAILSCIEEMDAALELDALVTLSEGTSRYLESVYGRKADAVIYPGVDRPDSVAPPAPGNVAVYAGRLWRHKRVDLLISAIAKVEGGQLRILGDGPERPSLTGLARELGVLNRVHFEGPQPRERLWRCYAEATCGVYTPAREPFGLMPLEMAAAGRPVIVAADAGVAEILDPTSAYLVGPRPGCIARAMSQLFDDPSLAARMGRAGWARAGDYGWDRTAAGLLEVLKSVRRSRLQPVAGDDRPLLGAHYYVWYDAGAPRRHWNDDPAHGTVTDPPVDGYYSSCSPGTIDRHLDLARRAGLDFLVVNWQVGDNGLQPGELTATRALFDAVERNPESGLRLSILLSIEASGFQAVTAAIEILESEFLHRPQYHRHDGRPLLWYFLSDAFLGHLYHNHDRLRALNAQFHPVASGEIPFSELLPRALRRFFRGWSLYSSFQSGSRESWTSTWQRSYHASAAAPRALRVFSISPGYDDRGLAEFSRQGVPNRCVPRDDGITYRNMQQAALALSPTPDLVVITSFNEFHENTHIEPSERWGDAYIHATRRFSHELRSLRKYERREAADGETGDAQSRNELATKAFVAGRPASGTMD